MDIPMAPKNKGITCHYPLKMTPAERELLETTQRVYAREGVEMSLNDTIRHLIRRAGIVLAHTPDAAWEQIRLHANACSDCDAEAFRFGCPDGVYLHRSWRRVLRAHQGTESVNAL
jgi:hypothetical protein